MWTVIVDKDDAIRVVDSKRLCISPEGFFLTDIRTRTEREHVYLPRGIEFSHDLPLFDTLEKATPFMVDYYSN